MKEFVGLRAKTYAYLMDDVVKRKKLKEQKKMCNKTRTYLKIIKATILTIKP